MRWLRKHGWQTLTAEQLRGFLEEGRPVPRRSVVLTFDDGYLDNWQYAHPVLKEYGFSAIMFVVTDWIGQGPARPARTLRRSGVTAWQVSRAGRTQSANA
nr:polysaccharide deacetylase family protein [Kerstersia gyiorum]